MTTALFLALILQQTAPGGVVWSDAPPPPVETRVEVAAPALPDWALADPYAWERAQCSPLLRKDVSMEACQSRVRADLTANLGDRLPESLRPSPTLENCAPDVAGEGYAVQCAPRQIAAGGPPPPQEQVCDPVRNASPAADWRSTANAVPRPAARPRPMACASGWAATARYEKGRRPCGQRPFAKRQPRPSGCCLSACP